MPFDDCLGTGGNDGVFSGNSQVASADFLPDNGGWQALYAGGAARCVKLGNATLAQTDFSMVKGKWTAFITKLNGTGATRITFTPGKRFFLDEVVVRRPNVASGISQTGKAAGKVVAVAYYTADGRRTAGPAKGLNLVRMSDGSVRKVILK